MMTLTQINKKFWNSDQVKTLQKLQSISAHGTAPHKFAHEAMLRLASKMGAKIDGLEIY
jgi:hypothetical protein